MYLTQFIWPVKPSIHVLLFIILLEYESLCIFFINRSNFLCCLQKLLAVSTRSNILLKIDFQFHYHSTSASNVFKLHVYELSPRSLFPYWSSTVSFGEFPINRFKCGKVSLSSRLCFWIKLVQSSLQYYWLDAKSICRPTILFGVLFEILLS